MNSVQSRNGKIAKTLTRLSTKALRVVAPELSNKLTRRVFLTPKRNKNKWPRRVKQFSTMTRYGRVRTYKYGQGKCIWFIHGWSSSAFDFWPLMQKLAEKGYCCLSFDFPAHGFSDGKQSSLPQMIKTFDDISASFLDPNMIITHSMGASTLANSHWFKQCKSDLLLISPVLNSYDLLQKMVKKSGYDQELFDQAIHGIYKKEKLFLPELDAIPKLKGFTGQLKIIHDKYDFSAPLSMSEELSQQAKAKLFTTNKLGHTKILRSNNILKVIESYQSMKQCHQLI